jgi:hypothetical protein
MNLYEVPAASVSTLSHFGLLLKSTDIRVLGG